MARRLLDAGFTDALALRGGLDAWRDTGRQLARFDGENGAAPGTAADTGAPHPKTA